ncbi:peripheral myelin protein 22-like [Ptychodera flava]|uniref:peripheral myelin protein 22-like n=1 Tax=Ptychodera flava TaxID=63121 RepID=UPI00396A2C7B
MSLVGPISSVAVAGVVVLFYIVSTATSHWVVTSTTSTGLWESCWGIVCGPLPDDLLTGYVKAARGLMLLAVIVAGISWILALVALIGKVTGKTKHLLCTKRFLTINALTFCATGLLVLIGTSVYAVEAMKDCGDDCSFGYSIILAWVSIPLGVVAAAMLTYFFRAMCDDA